MFSLTLENSNGDQLTFGQNSPFTISEIQGLNPPDATINTSQVALIDGARFNSAKLNMRTINVAFAIEYSASYNRIQVFKVLKSKQYVKLYYKGDYRDVWIEGYIQSIDISYFEKKQVVTCAILCPFPYFREAQQIINEIENTISTFHFPFTSTEEPELVFGYLSNDVDVYVENEGDVECGLTIELYARTAVSNPKIWNYISREYFGLNYEMQQADLITIDTRQGQKSVTLLRNGVESNIFNYVVQGSTWLQLSPEGDTFVYEVEDGNNADLSVTFKHDNLFEGV